MTYSSRLSALCDKIIEAGWLAAVVIVPLYFNIYSSRVFEPDKITLIRTIALLMVAAWIIRLIEERAGRRSGSGSTPSDVQRPLLNGVDWRTPLVLPTLALVVVYLVATIVSLSPSVSLLGSYQRLQGTYSTFSYIVVFFMILQGMRRRRQLDRLVTAIVMTSLPIAFYGVIQRADRDSLPWGGIVTERVAANMGNAIFVAAYLIMAFFLTLGRVIEAFRVILTEEESRISDILRASAYIFVGAVQLIGFSFAGSRGPLLGWLPGMFVFGLVGLLLLRVSLHGAPAGQAAENSAPPTSDAGAPSGASGFDIVYVLKTVALFGIRLAIAAGSGALVFQLFDGQPFLTRIELAAFAGGAVGLTALLAMVRRGEATTSDQLDGTSVLHALELSVYSLALALAAALLAFNAFPGPTQTELAAVAAVIGGLVPLLISAGLHRSAARWLWASWIFVVILGGVALFEMNFSDHPQMVELRRSGTFGTLGTLFESESGTGKVRTLIWTGAVELIEPHDPIVFPDGTGDALNPLRLLIGYGPESMYVAYNRFYPPDLAHYEQRNASPDRSHNETLDSVVITGAAGFLAEQFLFLSVFFYALKFIGWVPSRRAAIAFVGILIAGGALGALGLLATKGVNFMGTGWPGGVAGGIVLYVILFALFHFRISGRVYAIVAAALLAIVAAANFFATYASANRWLEIGIVGLIGGLAFAAMYVFGRFVFDPTAGQPIVVSGHIFLILALFGGMLAHYLEISLAGIAIAATRTYFWAFAGMLVVAGLHWVPADDEGAEEAARPAPAARPPSTAPRPKKRRAAPRPEPRPSPGRAAPSWLGPTIAGALVGALILITLGYDFINTPPIRSPDGHPVCAPAALPSSGTQVLWESLTRLPYKDSAELCQSAGVGLLFFVTWSFGAIATLTELRRRSIVRSGEWWRATLVYLGVSLGVAFAYWIFHAGLILDVVNRLQAVNATPASSLNDYIDRFVDIAEQMAGLLGLYYVAVIGILLGVAGSLYGEARARGLPAASEWGAIAGAPVMIGALVLAIAVNFNPIRADIIYKQGQPYVANNACSGAGSSPEVPLSQCDIAVAHLKRALQYAPNEDFYMLALGASYLNKSAGAPDQSPLLVENSTFDSILALDSQETAFLNRRDALTAARTTLERARQIAPLNTDHSANLARLHRTWADLAADAAEREQRLDQAADFYRQATTLSPHNAQLWNEWALVLFQKYGLAGQQGDTARAEAALQEVQAKLEESLRLDSLFSKTYVYLATLQSARGNSAEAEAQLLEALRLKPRPGTGDDWGPTEQNAAAGVWDFLRQGFLSTGNLTDTERLTRQYVERVPSFYPGWRVLTSIYEAQNRLSEALEAAQYSVDFSGGDPDRWRDMLVLARLLGLAGRLPEALQAAQGALEAAPPENQPEAQQMIDAIQALLADSAPQLPSP